MSAEQPLRQITLDEYEQIPADYRGFWTTERWQDKNWISLREKYLGKRTMMVNEGGATVLLIEGLHFEIIDPPGRRYTIRIPPQLVGTKEFIRRLTGDKLTTAQLDWAVAILRAKRLSFYDEWSRQHCSLIDAFSISKQVVLDAIRAALLRFDSLSNGKPSASLQTYKNIHYDRKLSYECTVLVFCQAQRPPADHWVECKSEEINCPYLYTEKGVRYFGWL